ncbi:hypothetical protein [Phascolarctobacterium sp.]
MIAIKGMDMPKRCLDCRFEYYSDATLKKAKCFVFDDDIDNETLRPDFCPLIEIKEVNKHDSD